MAEKKEGCLCGSGEKMVLCCSGASDLGQITDIVARRLRDEGVRKMNCMAVIGAGIEKSIENFKTKDILMIDGCPVDCGKKILDKFGFENYQYIRLTDLGLQKGNTQVGEESVATAFEHAKTFV